MDLGYYLDKTYYFCYHKFSLMNIPTQIIPIIKIPYSDEVELYIKREDLIHPEISGNKYWKLFYNIKNYLEIPKENLMLITFGGAFSNHIAATSALGGELGIKSLGIIRGEELEQKWQENPTLSKAYHNGMEFHFVTRDAYRDKENLAKIYQQKYPQALIIPEGGSNEWAVQGIQFMLDERTKDFDYLCTAVGTGGTIAGLSKYAEHHQKVLGFKVVNDNVEEKISEWSGKQNFELLDAWGKGYGRITEDLVLFIKEFQEKYQILLDPCYTSKMMKCLTKKIDEGFFPKGSKILAFHTGGIQGLEGMNKMKNTNIKI